MEKELSCIIRCFIVYEYLKYDVKRRVLGTVNRHIFISCVCILEKAQIQ